MIRKRIFSVFRTGPTGEAPWVSAFSPWSQASCRLKPVSLKRGGSLTNYVNRSLVRIELNVYSDSMGNPLHAAHAIHSDSSTMIPKRLSKARIRASEIAEVLESLETEDQREVYLVQRFLVDSLRGFRRSIVYGYFFSGFDWKRKSQSTIIPQLCFAGIPVYLLFAALFIFLYGVQIGQGATTYTSALACIT